MRKYGEIDKGMTEVYQLFEGVLVNEDFRKHLEYYIENYTAEHDEHFANLAGEMFKNTITDVIKGRRLLSIIEQFKKEVEDLAEEIRAL